MIILGINESHGASACLSIDGKIVAAAMEERFTRLKNDEGYPLSSIEYCLNEAGISTEEIDYVAMASEELEPVSVIVRRCSSYFSVDDWLKEQEEYWKPKLLEGKQPNYKKIFAYKQDPDRYPCHYDFSDLNTDADWMDRKLFLPIRKKHLINHLNIKEDIIRVVKHYRAHSYYGFYASQIPRKPTLVFHAESGGDGMNASVMRFSEDVGLEHIHLTDRCFLGRIYKYTTLLLGMLPAHHEYKVMGLAPYAKEEYLERSYKVFSETLKVNGLDFTLSKELTDCFWYFTDRLRGHRFDEIAGALQRFAEEIIVTWVKNAVEQTGISQIVFSGGVSMNVKINKLLCDLECIDNLFVPPSGGDESLSLGAMYKVLEDQWKEGKIELDDIKPFKTVYTGPAYEDIDISHTLDKATLGNGFKVIENVGSKEIAKFLAEGKVIARLKGRMEFGARALGNRSILANPAYPGIVKKINDQIKKRDFWMPFCPTIKIDRMHDYLINPKNISAPFMTVAFDTVKRNCDQIAGAIHPADHTARPQILKREENPEYYDLISEFEKITGIGALLNTSLNLHGSPIDCTPDDGIKTFLNSQLDGILLNETLVLQK